MFSVGITERKKYSMNRVWLLIYVHRGFIQEPELFFDEHSATARRLELLRSANSDYDEIDIFEKQL